MKSSSSTPPPGERRNTAERTHYYLDERWLDRVLHDETVAVRVSPRGWPVRAQTNPAVKPSQTRSKLGIY